MAEFEIPAGVPSDGMTTVWWVSALADPSKPTLSEINADGTALNVTCYLSKDGIAPDFDADTFTVERFCMKNTQETEGKVKWTIDDLMYIWDQQNPESDSNKMYAIAQEKLAGYFVIRYGKSAEDHPQAESADIVHVYSGRLGTRTPAKPEANSELYVKQSVKEVRRVVTDYKIAA